jgi:type I restriction enzyme S subunit
MSTDWRDVTLGDHVDLVTGFPFKSARFLDSDNGAVRLLRGDNVGQGALRWDGAKHWPEQETTDYTPFYLEERDVILAMDRPWIEAGLKYAWVRRSDLPCLLVQRVARLRGINGLSTDYLRYVLGSKEFAEYVKGITTGVNVPHISGKDIKRFRFSLPPLGDQEQIISILRAYDDLIEVNRRRIALLEEMARRLFEEWFVRFRFPGQEGQSIERQLPLDWKRVPIEQVYEGLYDGPHATPKPSTDGPVFLGIGNITEGGQLDLANVRHISEAEFPTWTRRVTPRAGDIVFTYEATLNRYAIIPHGFRGCLGRRLALIRTNPSSIYRNFLFLYFFSADWRETIARNVLSGATVERIPLSKFPTFPINVPPQMIAAKFDCIVQPVFDLVEITRKSNTILQAQRDLLLPRLISGELSVRAGERELEKVA